MHLDFGLHFAGNIQLVTIQCNTLQVRNQIFLGARFWTLLGEFINRSSHKCQTFNLRGSMPFKTQTMHLYTIILYSCIIAEKAIIT